MFVSMARIALAGALLQALFELSEVMGFRPPRGKQRLMNVLSCKSPSPAYEDSAADRLPFKNRSRTDAKLAPDVHGNRNLSLCG